MDTQQSADTQRDRYYATIHKVALQAGEKIPGILYYDPNMKQFDDDVKIPETSEDISPYATFQLSEASTLQQPHHSGPANTLLHSFMYHERAMTEGCASPPPAAVLRQLHNQSPYYNMIVRFTFYLPLFKLAFSFSSFSKLINYSHTYVV